MGRGRPCRFQFGGLQQNKKATDIISHSLSERRSISNVSWWSKLFNVTGCFTGCISAHYPAVKLDNTIWFILLSCPNSGVLGACGTAQSCRFSHRFFQNTSGLGVLACSIDNNLNYRITMLFMCTENSKSMAISYY